MSSARRGGSVPAYAAGRAGAGGEAAHERREHGAGGREAVAHVQREQARPDDFVDEGRGAGHREEDQERAAPHHERVSSPSATR